MVDVIEFRLWLVQCCFDAQKKLGLKNIEIAYALLQEAQKWLLEPLIDAEGGDCPNDCPKHGTEKGGEK